MSQQIVSILYVHEEGAALTALTKNLEEVNRLIVGCVSMRAHMNEQVTQIEKRLAALEKKLQVPDQMELPFGEGDTYANIRLT